MSGPVATDDASSEPGQPAVATTEGVQLESGRSTMVGSLSVRRVLPGRPRRTVGAWCFCDHMGPMQTNGGSGGAGIGPHPHMGLQTVTWLLAGELLHLDSLGSEQLIRPGQLNLMTAGNGVAHAEEDPGRATALHGVQLWVAQPEGTRHGPAGFEHHDADALPQVNVEGACATVMVGDFAGENSPARRDSEHVGVELALRAPGARLPLRADYEHAVVVLEGAVMIDGAVVEPGGLGLSRTGPRRVPARRARPRPRAAPRWRALD